MAGPTHAHSRAPASVAAADRSFTVTNNRFMKDGEEFQIMSGSIHYARIHPSQWADRLARMRALGLNAVETYVFWNWHEAEEGVVDFEGARNLQEFLSIAQEQGLLVLLRAGPYSCAEWEFGGFPGWLLNKTGIVLRTNNAPYIAAVDAWWKLLLPQVKPMLYTSGGPVIMMQVENEFGSYGDVSTNPLDKQYLEHLISVARSALGEDIVLYTTDGGNTGFLSHGTLPDSSVLSIVDFGPGTNIQDAFAAQDKYNPEGMRVHMCSEFYTGWLTHWGDKMANTSTSLLTTNLEQLLQSNASVSMYMGSGGTNWAFMNGANANSGATAYFPSITSYDYDSPISESGDHGYGPDGLDKYEGVRAVLAKFSKTPPPVEAPARKKAAYGVVQLTEYADLLDNMDTIAPTTTRADAPLTFEHMGQNYGFVLYTLTLSARPRALHLPAGAPQQATATYSLAIPGVRDQAWVFDGGDTYLGGTYRAAPANVTFSAAASGPLTLRILVENNGRINYGHEMTDPKGILGAVLLNGTDVASLGAGWAMQGLPMGVAQLSRVPFAAAAGGTNPAFWRGRMSIPQGGVADTFLQITDGWSHGQAWVNGFNLGRYWQSQGPQHTLYVPAAVLHEGANTVTLFETLKPSGGAVPPQVAFVSAPEFTH